MRRSVPVHQRVYEHLYPHPDASDPANFTAHLARLIIPEVRIEVATFYGDLNSVEARYPGLNYCYPPHRLRLGRFRHHHALFEAFDELGLTEQEIQDLCCWEGSKWAREKYEEDQGEKVIDTTGNDIGPWIDRRHMTEAERALLPRSRKMNNPQPIPHHESLRGWRKASEPIRTRQNVRAVLGAPGPTVEESHTPVEDFVRPSSTPAPSQNTQNVVSPATRLLPGLQEGLHILQRQIMFALQSGNAVPPDLEALIKDHVDRGELPQDFVQQAHRIVTRGQRQQAY